MNPTRAPAGVILALGVTQIVGFGAIFYSYAILAPAIAAEFAWPEQWAYAILSAAFLAAGLIAPYAGRLADRHGAGRVLTWGSVAASAMLVAVSLSPNGLTFAVTTVALQMTTVFILYAMAFTAIVQIGGQGAALGIVHLTLIGGFASTLFWPLTTWLMTLFGWREIYQIFAAINLVLCVPLHAWIAGVARRRAAAIPPEAVGELPAPVPHELPHRRRSVFLLMLLAIAAEGFVITCVLIHLVPLTAALGMGAAGLWAASLFGPAQVASRLINMVFGGRLQQVWVAVIAATLLPVGIVLLMGTTPWLPGAVVFVVLFGLSSGLNSIIGGTLPLELFGRKGFGAMAGWASAARQFAAAFSPFALSVMLASIGVMPSLATLLAISFVGLGAFLAIAVIRRG